MLQVGQAVVQYNLDNLANLYDFPPLLSDSKVERELEDIDTELCCTHGVVESAIEQRVLRVLKQLNKRQPSLGESDSLHSILKKLNQSDANSAACVAVKKLFKEKTLNRYADQIGRDLDDHQRLEKFKKTYNFISRSPPTTRSQEEIADSDDNLAKFIDLMTKRIRFLVYVSDLSEVLVFHEKMLQLIQVLDKLSKYGLYQAAHGKVSEYLSARATTVLEFSRELIENGRFYEAAYLLRQNAHFLSEPKLNSIEILSQLCSLTQGSCHAGFNKAVVSVIETMVKREGGEIWLLGYFLEFVMPSLTVDENGKFTIPRESLKKILSLILIEEQSTTTLERMKRLPIQFEELQKEKSLSGVKLFVKDVITALSEGVLIVLEEVLKTWKSDQDLDPKVVRFTNACGDIIRSPRLDFRGLYNSLVQNTSSMTFEPILELRTQTLISKFQDVMQSLKQRNEVHRGLIELKDILDSERTFIIVLSKKMENLELFLKLEQLFFEVASKVDKLCNKYAEAQPVKSMMSKIVDEKVEAAQCWTRTYASWLDRVLDDDEMSRIEIFFTKQMILFENAKGKNRKELLEAYFIYKKKFLSLEERGCVGKKWNDFSKFVKNLISKEEEARYMFTGS